jgi:hypothetical protein
VNKNYNKTVVVQKHAALSRREVPNQSSVNFDEERELALMYRNFFGRGDYKFAIYPSHWKDAWGRAPLLGIVFADNEFLAERLAYDKGILPTHFNCTFQPKIKNLGPNRSKF